MKTTETSLPQLMGGRVREARLRLGWTLDGLAAASGVSRRQVVNLEQGAANPIIGTLLRISDALGVGLPAIVTGTPETPTRVTRKEAAPTLWRGQHGGYAALVAATEPPNVVELWDWRLSPGDAHYSEAHASGTTELLQVLDGSVDLSVGDEAFMLEAGDAITFAGDVAHSYRNQSNMPARFSLAVYEPDVGSDRNGARRAR